MKLTDSDKIDIAKYVVKLLAVSLTKHGDEDATLEAWMERAEGECVIRLGDYLKSYNRIGR